MWLTTFHDTLHRRTRFAVVTAIAAVVLALLFVMTGLVEQFQREGEDSVAAIGAATWLVPAGIDGPITAVSTLPSQVLADPALAGGPLAAAPAVLARASLRPADGPTDGGARGTEVLAVGHVPGALGAPPVVAGRGVRGRGEAVVDTSAGLAVGQRVNISDTPVTVVGLSTDTTVLAGIPLAFLALGDAQDLAFGTEEVVTAVLLSGAPATLPAGTRSLTAAQVAADALEPLQGAIATLRLLQSLLVGVVAVVIGGVVHLTALDRERDVAVMRALGASGRGLTGSIALQAALIGLVAAVLASGLQAVMAPAFPLRVRVPQEAFWQVPLLSVAIALLAGATGITRVLRADPALAFRGAA
jgi:putative ABC transport system permease protein